jgi:hypothetical protein
MTSEFYTNVTTSLLCQTMLLINTNVQLIDVIDIDVVVITSLGYKLFFQLMQNIRIASRLGGFEYLQCTFNWRVGR